MAKNPTETAYHEGVIPPEFSADEIGFVRDGNVVHIWFYSRVIDPLGGGHARTNPIATIKTSTHIFDAFIAKGMIRVAEKIADGVDEKITVM